MGGGCGPDGFDVALQFQLRSSFQKEPPMRLPRIRFSLLGLLAAISLLGAVLACIVNFGLSLPMVTIVWSVLLLALITAPALAFVGLERRRTFYGGFAWFGWMYVLVCVLGQIAHSSNSFMSSASASPLGFPQLAIENGMFLLYKWVVPRESWIFNGQPQSFRDKALGYDSLIWNPPQPAPTPTVPAGGMGGLPTTGTAPGGGFFSGTMPMNPTLQQPHRIIPWVVCRDIGHALLAAQWAILGGCLVAWIARRNARRKLESATPTPQ